jgi:RimJ/RimL family protein N-acetyltransferase
MSALLLRGERVILRRLAKPDAPRLAEMVNRPEVQRTTRLSGRISVAAEEAFIEAVAEARDQLVLAITAADDGRLLGVAGLHGLVGDGARQAELGIFIGDPAEWGKGFATDAVRLLAAHGFGALRLNRIWLHVHADNAAGIRAYERVGFRREGLLRQAAARDGALVDVVVMAVLRSEWT